MINVAICDDNKIICTEIENVISEFRDETSIKISIEVYYTGEVLLQDLENGKYYDIVFLDIELDVLNGIDIGLAIRKKLNLFFIEIVYISSYTKYALRLFKTQPMDFLIKPLKKDKIVEIMNLLLQKLNISCQSFTYKIGRDEQKIPLKDIIYFESLKREVEIHLINKKIIRFYCTMKAITEQLLSLKANFISPHKTFIINYHHIECFYSNYILLNNDEQIPISRGKKKDLFEYQQKFLSGQKRI